MNKFFFRLPIQKQILFAKNLAVMAKAGMPLIESLQLIKKQTNSKTMNQILDQIILDVSNGQFLSASLEKFRNVFGDFAVNIIRVGESSGILSENLNYLADELKKKRDLEKQVMGALLYPIILVIVATIIIGILMIYVFPKILPVLRGLKVELPWTTRFLIAGSDFLIHYGFFLVIGVITFLALIWFSILKVKLVKLFFHRVILLIPVFGRISRNYNLANFCRTLGLLLKSDIKVVEALLITADTLSNLVYKNNIKEIATGVSKGEEISRYLETKPNSFPVTLSQMVAIGERTGNLSESLLYLSDFYESELNETTKNLSSVLEPVMMIVMGVIVAFIALSIITPIYQISKSF